MKYNYISVTIYYYYGSICNYSIDFVNKKFGVC